MKFYGAKVIKRMKEIQFNRYKLLFLLQRHIHINYICVGYYTIYAHVAQWIEQRFPKPLVGGSIPLVGTIVSLEPLII